jgi:serine/threonine protein kinase
LFTEEEAKQIILMMLQGMSHIHAHGIVHRDIKLQNVLIDENTNDLKIIDFGVSMKRELCSNKRVRVGTLKYMAPEVFTSNYSPESYTTASDIWAVGVTLYILFSGCYPFDGEDVEEFSDDVT